MKGNESFVADHVRAFTSAAQRCRIKREVQFPLRLSPSPLTLGSPICLGLNFLWHFSTVWNWCKYQESFGKKGIQREEGGDSGKEHTRACSQRTAAVGPGSWALVLPRVCRLLREAFPDGLDPICSLVLSDANDGSLLARLVQRSSSPHCNVLMGRQLAGPSQGCNPRAQHVSNHLISIGGASGQSCKSLLLCELHEKCKGGRIEGGHTSQTGSCSVLQAF